MDPTSRRWWRLIEDLPAKISAVAVFKDIALPPANSDGHLHATPTSIICLDGVVRITVPRRSIDLHPNQALILGAGIWHRHEQLRGGSIWFGQSFAPIHSEIIIGDHSREWHGRLPSQPSRKLMDLLFDEPSEDERISRMKELVSQILIEAVEDSLSADPALQRMISRLWSSLHRGVTVEDLVAASGLSRAQAYRIFTDGYGIPPKRAIQTARLWLADGLLGRGLSMTCVAERCGFPNPVTFTRAWKRIRGFPPSQIKWRE